MAIVFRKMCYTALLIATFWELPNPFCETGPWFQLKIVTKKEKENRISHVVYSIKSLRVARKFDFAVSIGHVAISAKGKWTSATLPKGQKKAGRMEWKWRCSTWYLTAWFDCLFARQVLGSGTGFKSSTLQSSWCTGDGNLEWIPRTGSKMPGQCRFQISRGHTSRHG